MEVSSDLLMTSSKVACRIARAPASVALVPSDGPRSVASTARRNDGMA